MDLENFSADVIVERPVPAVPNDDTRAGVMGVATVAIEERELDIRVIYSIQSDMLLYLSIARRLRK